MKRIQTGATYVEFAVGFSFMMILAFFFVDVGMALFRYHYLTDRTASFARKISAKVITEMHCDSNDMTCCLELANKSQEQLNILVQEPIVQKMGFVFSPVVVSHTAAQSDLPYPLLTIQGNWNVNCLFCRFIKRNGFTLKSSSSIVIEGSKTQCTNMTCTEGHC